MEKALTIQLKIPEEVNRKLRIEALRRGVTLREYCVKVLTDHVNGK